jgi:hypothetical protein
VNLGLAAVAVAIVAGGVIAVSAREARVGVLGLTLCAVTVPLMGGALPEPLPLAARLVAAILAGYLLWMAVRRQPLTRGSTLGWPVEALLAIGAGVAGFAASGFAGPAGGPPEAEATAFALAALAIGPLLVGRDILRLAIGLVLSVLAGSVGRVALVGSPSPLEQLVLAGLTVAVAGAAGTIARGSIRAGSGLELHLLRRPAAGPADLAGPRGPAAEEGRVARDGTPRQAMPGPR